MARFMTRRVAGATPPAGVVPAGLICGAPAG
ncbi:hypothetical protein L539_3853 [Bordetella hinzii 5132]|nr:hypothetical protein L539_3853 [Bordetella hinzii 5132]